MTDIQRLENYYANTLIVQYNDKPKAKATIKLLTDLTFANMIYLQIQNGFNWKEAKGEPLDWIGKWVGVDRTIYKSVFDDHNWFSLTAISGAISPKQGGFADLDNFDTNPGGFLTGELVTTTKAARLSDDNFRFLIGLKIIKNSISHTCKNIDDAIYNYSSGDIYTTWNLTNRTLTYNYPILSGDIMEIAQKKGVLPCPPTCKIILKGIE